tara:strand:+ start:6330 stop:8099 length:1770 start_codon:yes stop_codon:yes gene_type:complete
MEFKKLSCVDCEVYPNYFLAAFKTPKGKVMNIEARDGVLDKMDLRRLQYAMMKRTTFGFNSRNYDIPIILSALKGATTEQIHKVSDWIIDNGKPGWLTSQHFNLGDPNWPHFDLQEPAPGVMVGLKLYGARMHSPRLQDLPYEPGTHLTPEQMDDVRDYCENDLDTTIDLFKAIRPQLELRQVMSKAYNQDLMSKSDAQIAETVLKASKPSVKKPKIPESKKFSYNTPDFLHFKSQQLQDALNVIEDHKFEIDGRGSIKLPDELRKLKITLGGSTYQMGIGGLHSTEKAQTVVPTENQLLCDRDVASYYPSIILNLGLYPRQFGPQFLDTYRSIVDERLTAKRTGKKVKADALKITINGSFGKLGSKYSALYAPDLMMMVTLTGQLSLLMLIERLEGANISVVSANTDGFVSLVDKEDYQTYNDICFDWELDTGFELEETRYKALYSRDINNYLAVTEHGAKGKGVFAAQGLMKNPVASICVEAAKAYLITGRSIKSYIEGCKDIKPFITARRVTGGAVWRGEYLGKVVRWVYTTDGEAITYKKNGNKVATSDGATPVMDMPDEIPNLDYNKYITMTEDILKSVGVDYA